MNENTGELLQIIGTEALRAAPDGWTELTITAAGMGSGTDIDSTATTVDGEVDLDVAVAGAAAIHKLRTEMFQPGTGTWYRATLTIGEDKQVKASFDYDS